MRLNTKEWDRTFQQYMKLSKRDLAESLNAKGFFIARRAVVETPKAKLSRLTWNTARILGMIINKRRGEQGLKGLYGAEMAKEVELLYAHRRRSVAFLKSGWLPAIRLLETKVPAKYRRGAAKNDNSAKQRGKPKGKAIPAGTGWKVVTIIENAAIAKHDKKEALKQFGGPALQRAFDHEVRSMKEYIERKMKNTAQSVGIKTS